MNPYNFPQCYFPSATYYFAPIQQEQQGDLSAVVQNQKREIQTLKQENAQLRERIVQLQQQKQEAEKRSQEISSIRRGSDHASLQSSRKRKKTIEHKFTCPYDDCTKFYGSSLALNLHIKLKHNGGTKKERQTYAKIILSCEQKGQEPPKFDCTFPPGFLEEQKKLRNTLKIEQNE